jgi:hypothetical protein
MKKSIGSALHCNRQVIASNPTTNRHRLAVMFYSTMVLIGILSSGCKKENSNAVAKELQSTNSNASVPETNPVISYTGLSSQTTWELQQARSATARYRDIRNAIQDGYSNINVDVPNMGHHFMNTSLIDGTFDIRHPEILVYNGLDTGNPELVAVEYAVPLTYPRPEGFTGSSDVWNDTSGFPFWLVHAWVWKYNPDGVFNWTNSSVDLD